jgi:hypothetical protein
MLPVFDKVKAATGAAALVGAITAAIVGVFPGAAEYGDIIAYLIDGLIGGTILGAVTFIAGYFKKENAVEVRAKGE